MRRLFLFASIFIMAGIACGQSASGATPVTVVPMPTPEHSVFDEGRTVYGFFPSPPELTIQSVMDTIKNIGNHGDVVLLQRNIPWNDFVSTPNAASTDIEDIDNLLTLARQNNLEPIFVIDPLNGLNRREFSNLPFGWTASFGNPSIRSAYINYTMRILEEYHPRYLGLASEINTYADTHPDDFPNFLSLYRILYDEIKAESPSTMVFVTFQWEELNNLIPGISGGHKPYDTRWDQIRAFEPRLDLWAISSYPFIAFQSGKGIPSDYYSRLLQETDKPLAVAEGGYISNDTAQFHGTSQDQADYLEAIHTQIGSRLAFWIYLLYSDLNLDSYSKMMNQKGQGNDVNTLGYFVTVGLTNPDGTPKPALSVWDSFNPKTK